MWTGAFSISSFFNRLSMDVKSCLGVDFLLLLGKEFFDEWTF